MVTPELRTARLLLRPRVAEDAVVVRRLWSERDPRVPAHRRLDAEGHPTVGELATGFASEPGWFWTVVQVAGGVAIGYCALVPRGRGTPEEPELAYEFLRSHHGQGYATESARAVVAWAAGAGHRRLFAGISDWNVASSNVVRKLGFADTGRREPGANGESLVYALTIHAPTV
ncbi:GNAT family N-acetyltransferase [Jatrophihabitans sp. YIM 134969]